MIEWNYIVIGLCLLLLLFLIVKEVRRKNKARLLWRLLATILSVTSLGCIALPITYHRVADGVNNNAAVFLTDGYNTDSLNKFIGANGANFLVFTTEKNLKNASKYNTVYAPDASSFLQQHKGLNTVHLFGYGLDEEELNAFKNVHIVYHEADSGSSGVTTINWNRLVNKGEKLTVQGSFNNFLATKATIVLKSFNATVDSVSLPPGRKQHFQLTTIPKSDGRTVYSLLAISGKDTLEKELIPLQVMQGERVKILMLSSSPDFENKFLKDWLAKNSYPVVARTAISKNKFAKDFLNTTPVSVDRITSSLLNKFDITIADAAELKSLTVAELSILRNQIEQNGMGLIVKTDTATSNASFYASSFQVGVVSGSNQQPVSLFISDSTNNLPAVNIENLLFIKDQSGTQPLVFDKQNRVFASRALLGSGKIILTTVTNTFSWILSGAQKGYDLFWSELLNKGIVKHSNEEAWLHQPALPEINNPVQLQFQTNNNGIPRGQVEGSAVYLKQSDELPFLWTGTFYPEKEAWQTGIQMNGKTFYWFAFNKNDWKNIRANTKMETTKRYVEKNNNTTSKAEKEVEMTNSEVPKLLFFLLFLLFASFLWFENKL